MHAYRLETAAETGDRWTGIIYHFEDWLRPHLDSGALEPVPRIQVTVLLGAVPLLSAATTLTAAAASVRHFIQAHRQGSASSLSAAA